MKITKLLELIVSEHPDGIDQGERHNRAFNMLFEFPPKWEVPEIIRRLTENSQEADGWNIDMKGISVISPPASRTLITAAVEIATTLKKPVILTNVEEEFALPSLETEAWYIKSPPLWVLNEKREARILGKISKTHREILKALQEEPASAKQLAAKSAGNKPSKEQIGNLSSYLASLFKTGLVVRERVGGLDREDAERGWTFRYRAAISLIKS